MRETVDEVIRRASEPSPACPACGSPFLAWQPQLRCVLWRCPRCGFIERDLRLAPAGARSLEYGGDQAGDRIRLALTERRLRRRLGPALRGRLLEIGAGDACLAARLAPGLDEVVAIERLGTDPSPAAVAAGVTSLAGRWEDADLPASSFDVLVAVHVLEHVDDLLATLERARVLLVPGGVLYAITPNADCAALRTFGEHWWMLEDPTHVRFLSAASLPHLAGRGGFSTWRARPLMADSLAVEAATTARALGIGDHDKGALGQAPVRAAAAAGLPLTLVLRTLRPRWRPALEIELRTAP